MITFYHNPRCSKSRQVQQWLTDQDIEFITIDYLKTPLTYDELNELSTQLAEPIQTMIRTNERVFSELHLTDPDEKTLLTAIAKHPILLQRPIVVHNNRATIARPPEKVIAFLTGSQQ